MISTWGIFWICFFGGWLLATLIRNVCRCINPNAYKFTFLKLSEKEKQEYKNLLIELSTAFGKSITINCDCTCVSTAKKAKRTNKD